VEEIDEFPRGIKLPSHEERARSILQNSAIGNVIKNEWEIEVEEVVDLITNDSKKEILNSFLSSVIDIDKLDYLYRDSIHCGVSYGKGIDIERLLDSLYVNTEKKRLCVTEKGQSTLLSILSARNIMYQAVYWHKTVRASEAMFKRFFYEYVLELTKESPDNDAIYTELGKLFYHSDDEFTATLYRWAKRIKNQSLQELIQPFAYGGRKIYKPAYIYFDHNSENSTKIDKFFRSLLTKKYSYKDLIAKSNRFSELLQKTIPDIQPLDIIFETTPIGSGERDILGELSIYNTKKQRYDKLPTAMDSLNDYLGNNSQAYIFCHPRIYKPLKELLLDTETFVNLLDELNKK
jgi:HD superfamily phosphohydrolase